VKVAEEAAFEMVWLATSDASPLRPTNFIVGIEALGALLNTAT
jgi:hypothetical protein